MEKQEPLSKELQCVGRLEIARTRPAGFLCGSIPVSTDETFHGFTSSALVPSSASARAPRYQMIPKETDLNALPLHLSDSEKVLPIARTWFRAEDDSAWKGGPALSNIGRKVEELAICGVVDYGDEVDVIAPADVLKQILKIPYSKARVSVAIHRVGQTLILNTGPDVEEGEKLIQRQNNPPKCVDQSLLLNFAMRSVRMEACDCPPSHNISGDEQYKSFIYSDDCQKSAWNQMGGNVSYGHHGGIAQVEEYPDHNEFILGKENLPMGNKRNNQYKAWEAVKKASEFKEKPGSSVQESESYVNISGDSFSRVFFWQFHNFRMLLGSDMLIFSNDKYSAVSLHLWDVSLKVTPLNWLEAWLDNFMASVPELAICYHRDGVVQGYELLKTDDIFLLKGISDDGAPAFHPHVVQKNGLSVMKFLQENCQQEPGVYWLYRNAGEDVIQLFDLSVIPKNHSSDGCRDNPGCLPSFIYRGRTDSVLSLGTLLYRIAQRLSLSWPVQNKARSVMYFQKCFGLLENPDHLVVRALAHEQFARLLLNYDDEVVELLPAAISAESEVTISDPFELMTSSLLPTPEGVFPPALSVQHGEDVGFQHELEQDASADASVSQNTASHVVVPDLLRASEANDKMTCRSDRNILVTNLTKFEEDIGILTDTLAAKLAAVHHVSQAIKSLRWARKLQSTRQGLQSENSVEDGQASPMDSCLCACGVLDCMEICDIREWLPTYKMDDRLRKLVLLLGESYLALGEAHKEEGQLYQALKVIELACLVYGSMPQDSRFISSIDRPGPEVNDKRVNAESSLGEDVIASRGLSSNFVFWAKSWALVGDVFVEFHKMKGQELCNERKKKNCANELKISFEVLKELRRLKKKLGQSNQNCSSCSLVNCSCQNDRATSGNSASSSGRATHSSSCARKQNKKGRTIQMHACPCNSGVSRIDLNSTNDAGTSDTKSIVNKGAKAVANSDIGLHLVASTSVQCYSSPEMDKFGFTPETDKLGSASASPEIASGVKTAAKCGGIFKYLRDSVTGYVDHILSIALNCYEESCKAMDALPATSGEVQSVLKKIGWVCNELGRDRLEANDIGRAEAAFLKAIDAFKCVGGIANIILICCNLGHGRRALAEEMVANTENLNRHAVLRNACMQATEAAISQYSEAIRYYGTAKAQLSYLAGPDSSSLKNEVRTQLAHTYLKLGMLLSRENAVGEVYEDRALDGCSAFGLTQALSEHRKHDISANEAIREALSVYESLGAMRRQEAAYAHYQLACYQRDCCMRFLDSDIKKPLLSQGDNGTVKKLKQYASLAERHWQKSSDFYGPNTHPVMYVTILIDRSTFSLSLSRYLHSSSVLESALTRLLEGRHVSVSLPLCNENNDICARFWGQMQMVLKSMLATLRPPSLNKQQCLPGGARKLSELYKISLKASGFTELHKMNDLWTEL